MSVESVKAVRLRCDRCKKAVSAIVESSTENGDPAGLRIVANNEGFHSVSVVEGLCHDLCRQCVREVRQQLGTERQT